MKKKYFNDAFIGNKNITASFSKYGELLRLYYPLPDFRQYVDFFHVGLKINDSNIIYLHNDVNNRYNQYYTEDTNILNTEIENTYFNLKIKQIDCTMINKDILIRKYTFENNHSIDLKINFLIHSKLMSSFNNMTGSLCTDDSLIQYAHNFTCVMTSKNKLLSHQLNNCERNINSGVINDKDYIGMSPDAAISYDLGTLKPGEKTEISIVTYLTYEATNVNMIKEKITELKKINVNKEISKIEEYWKKFVDKHDTFKLKSDGSDYMNKLIQTYKRTILYMPLLTNERTGAISASVEVDEEQDNCGRYSYSWPRDVMMVYDGINYLNFDEYCKKYYEVFLKKAQDDTGMWEQRFYTDGTLAPCWGYQVDETAIVVWGAYQYYKQSTRKNGKKDISFLKENLKMIEKATAFLVRYINFVLGKEEKDDLVRIELEKEYKYKERDQIYKHPSYDLWEMNEGVHLYSVSAIYGALNSMIKIYEELQDSYQNNRLKRDDMLNKTAKYKELKREIRAYIMDKLYDKQKKVLVRNTKDCLTDISIMGAVVPFEVFDPDEKVIQNTVEQINMTLRTYLGGYLRFQNDTYMGGTNPWIIATAWMGLYYNKIGDKKEANNCLQFIVNSASNVGLLAEQANSDLNEKWVNGLAWSHAMFIKLVKELYKKDI